MSPIFGEDGIMPHTGITEEDCMGDAPPRLAPLLQFLSTLEEHNNQSWFEQHQAEHAAAEAAFLASVEQIIRDFGRVEDLGSLRARQCLVGVHQVPRLTRDQATFRPVMAASLVARTKRRTRLPYFLQIAPGGRSFAAGGLFMPTGSQLSKLRAEIDSNASPLHAIIRSRTFRTYFGTLQGERTAGVAPDYASTHPHAGLLRHRQMLAIRPFPDAVVLTESFIDEVVRTFTALKPLLDYLNSAIR